LLVWSGPPGGQSLLFDILTGCPQRFNNAGNLVSTMGSLSEHIDRIVTIDQSATAAPYFQRRTMLIFSPDRKSLLLGRRAPLRTLPFFLQRAGWTRCQGAVY
jgi:hypothetical protein